MITFKTVPRDTPQSVMDNLVTAIKATKGRRQAVEIQCNGVPRQRLQSRVLMRLAYHDIKAATRSVGDKTLLAWVP